MSTSEERAYEETGGAAVHATGPPPDLQYGMLREIGKWCCVEEQPPTGKTRRFIVTDAAGNPLGDVKWFSTWRRYAFYPGRLTVYEPTCLRDIAAFIDEITAERRSGPRRGDHE